MARHSGVMRRFAAVMMVWLAIGAFGHQARVGWSSSSSTALTSTEERVFLTDDLAQVRFQGCDAISVWSAAEQTVVAYGDGHVSPGQLALSPDGSLAVSISNNSGHFLYVFRETGENPARWTTSRIDLPTIRLDLINGSASAITPDGAYLLLPSLDGVEKYRLANLTNSSLGPLLGRFESSAPVALEVSADSRTGYNVGVDGFVYTFDIDSMSASGNPIPYPPATDHFYLKFRQTFASLSPDGRYLVVNTLSNRLTVVDLERLVSVGVKLHSADESWETWGLRFNHAPMNHGRLAVHGGDRIGVFEFSGVVEPRLVASAAVPAQPVPSVPPWNPDQLRIRALAWTADGSNIIAAIEQMLPGPRGRQDHHDWRMLTFAELPTPRLDPKVDFASCKYDDTTYGYIQSHSLDVRTLNGPGLNPTPTPEPRATVTLTLTPSPSPSAMPRPTETPSATPTPTASATPTSTTQPTRMLAPVFLPITLREVCEPGTRRADVALVIDTSTSMAELTSAQRRKLDAARAAAAMFLDQLKLDAGDQAAVVWFNESAAVEQSLTSQRSLLDGALGRLNLHQFTRIDLGIALAREELVSPHRLADNTPVMVVLTDGRANPVPVTVAVEEARQAKEAGIWVFTVGIGSDLDEAALRVMASRSEWFYVAPDAEQLADIYRAIAVTLPCSPASFWGGR